MGPIRVDIPNHFCELLKSQVTSEIRGCVVVCNNRAHALDTAGKLLESRGVHGHTDTDNEIGFSALVGDDTLQKLLSN